MNRSRIARILLRTPGEVAFDRCFFPLAAVCILDVLANGVAIVYDSATSTQGHTEAEIAVAAPVSRWPLWIAFLIGLVTAFLWLRALISVVMAWRDPSASVLRFSAVGLLLFLAVVTVSLLRLPFA